MCLAFTGKVLEVTHGEITIVRVDFGGGVIKQVGCLIDDPQVGDYVKVYAAAVIEKVQM